jgi:hypothetical protein
VRKTRKKEDEEEEEETDMSLIRDGNKAPTLKWKFSHQTNNNPKLFLVRFCAKNAKKVRRRN